MRSDSWVAVLHVSALLFPCRCAAAGAAGFVFELLSCFAWPGCLSLPTGGVVGLGPLPPLSP